jgi:hypothetical protein
MGTFGKVSLRTFGVFHRAGPDVAVRAINGHVSKCGYRVAWIVISGKRRSVRLVSERSSSAAVANLLQVTIIAGARTS